MSTANVIKGSCLCQRVQYEVTGPPKMRLLCHCDNCRKVTGSTFMANALYQKDVSSPTQPSKPSNSLKLTGFSNCASYPERTSSKFTKTATRSQEILPLGNSAPTAAHRCSPAETRIRPLQKGSPLRPGRWIWGLQERIGRPRLRFIVRIEESGLCLWRGL